MEIREKMKAITFRRNITNAVDQRGKLLIVTEITIDLIGHLFQSVI